MPILCINCFDWCHPLNLELLGPYTEDTIRTTAGGGAAWQASSMGLPLQGTHRGLHAPAWEAGVHGISRPPQEQHCALHEARLGRVSAVGRGRPAGEPQGGCSPAHQPVAPAAQALLRVLGTAVCGRRWSLALWPDTAGAASQPAVWRGATGFVRKEGFLTEDVGAVNEGQRTSPRPPVSPCGLLSRQFSSETLQPPAREAAQDLKVLTLLCRMLPQATPFLGLRAAYPACESVIGGLC